MLNFDYHVPTEIIFRKNQISKLKGKLKDYNKILFVWIGGSIKKIGGYDKVKEALKTKTF